MALVQLGGIAGAERAHSAPMFSDQQRLIQECLHAGVARVLDVGAGDSPFPLATHVLDSAAPRPSQLGINWIQRDMCERTPWPFADKTFDFCVCSHALEDVKDPLWVCQEMSRVAHRGFIETPSRCAESAFGVCSPFFPGWPHHRWFVELIDGTLVFTPKSALLGGFPELCFRSVDWTREIVALEWVGQVPCRESSFTTTELVLRDCWRFKAAFVDAGRRDPLLRSALTRAIPSQHRGSLGIRVKRRLHRYLWRGYRAITEVFWG